MKQWQEQIISDLKTLRDESWMKLIGLLDLSRDRTTILENFKKFTKLEETINFLISLFEEDSQ